MSTFALKGAGVVTAADVAPSTRMGGELRALLTPGRVGATDGFLGLGRLDGGSAVHEHYHPFSDEFIFVTDGALSIRVDGDATFVVGAGSGVMIRRGQRHRFEAEAQQTAWVYVMTPLAPSPELGHVDTEPMPDPAAAPPSVGVR